MKNPRKIGTSLTQRLKTKEKNNEFHFHSKLAEEF